MKLFSARIRWRSTLKRIGNTELNFCIDINSALKYIYIRRDNKKVNQGTYYNFEK